MFQNFIMIQVYKVPIPVSMGPLSVSLISMIILMNVRLLFLLCPNIYFPLIIYLKMYSYLVCFDLRDVEVFVLKTKK